MTIAATWTFSRNQRLLARLLKPKFATGTDACWKHQCKWWVSSSFPPRAPGAQPDGKSYHCFLQGSRGWAHLLLTPEKPQLSYHFSHSWCDHEILKLKAGPPGRRKTHQTGLNPKHSWHAGWDQIQMRNLLPFSLYSELLGVSEQLS